MTKNLLKGHNINKNKKKVFILYCENNKLNWILFRNIIVVSHYHFQLDPVIYNTDTIGFQEITQDIELNPYNPTFNILTVVDKVFTDESLCHYDIKGIKYVIDFEEMEYVLKERTNLFFFTDNKKELGEIVKKTRANKEWETVIFHLKTRKEKNEHLKEFEDCSVWEIKYNPKIIKKWDNVGILEAINEHIYFRKEHGLRSLRNKIFCLMNKYYRNPIIPSYYNDEEKFESSAKQDQEKIDLMYK